MKIFVGLLFVAVAFSDVFAVPAGSPNDDAEVISVPRRRPVSDPNYHDFKGVIDTGAGYPFLQPVPHTFSFNLGFFDSFDDLFRRLRTRLWGADSDSDSTSSEDAGFPLSFNPPKKGNTTSTVEVVNGHKVEINETVYGNDDGVFKVRIVNIRPLEDGESVEETVKSSDDSDVDNKNPSPVTSAPGKNKETAESDDSDERREPLDDKKPNENEINRDIDGPEVKY